MDPVLQFKMEPRDDASPTPPKKKQKRNKPTLSCEECVERKTKVRPVASRCRAFAASGGAEGMRWPTDDPIRLSVTVGDPPALRA